VGGASVHPWLVVKEMLSLLAANFYIFHNYF
jgi:hypothetical protein